VRTRVGSGNCRWRAWIAPPVGTGSFLGTSFGPLQTKITGISGVRSQPYSVGGSNGAAFGCLCTTATCQVYSCTQCGIKVGAIDAAALRPFRKYIRSKATREKTRDVFFCFGCDFCGWYIFRKIITTVATRYHILKLKCTKFDFIWGSAPDPAGGAYSAPPDPLVGFRGGLCNVRKVRKRPVV